MKDKQYEIQGVKLSMGVMTLGQDKKLLELLDGKKVDFEKMTGGIQSIISHLIGEGIIEPFLHTILRGDTEALDMDEIDNNQLKEILSDFFGLNGGWIQELINSLAGFLKLLN